MNARQGELEKRIADAEARELALRSGTDFDLLGDDDEAEESDDAGSAALAFVREHPLAVVGGALVLGALVAFAIPKSPVRKAGKKLGGKVASQGSRLGAAVTQFALAIGGHLFEALQDARDTGKGTLSDVSDSAAQARKTAKRAASKAGRTLAGKIRRG